MNQINQERTSSNANTKASKAKDNFLDLVARLLARYWQLQRQSIKKNK